MTARILVAQEIHVLTPTELALRGYNVLRATTYSEAVNLLEKNNVDLFVLGVHFDDSRALELLTHIRTFAKYRETPVIVVRLLASDMANVLRKNVEALIRVKAVTTYLELEGDPNAILKIRQAVNSLVAPDQHVLETP